MYQELRGHHGYASLLEFVTDNLVLPRHGSEVDGLVDGGHCRMNGKWLPVSLNEHLERLHSLSPAG
jgi:hypothetical protein